MCSGRCVVDGTGEEVQGVYDAVFRSECGLAYIEVLVLHSVTDYLFLGVFIHCSMTSVVVESRAYDVSITCLACVGIDVYEDTASCRTKWGGIVAKWAC